jgi:hypothetical protein
MSLGCVADLLDIQAERSQTCHEFEPGSTRLAIYSGFYICAGILLGEGLGLISEVGTTYV